MKTIGELPLLPVWISPSHLVSSAKILLVGHRLRSLGVIEGGQLVGTIGFEELLGAADPEEVGTFVRAVETTVSPSEPVRAVADIMAHSQLDYVPVVEQGRFLGMVTATMLLKELGRSWDPLTGLSWSDGLRDWGIQQLKDGREITILFVDLDDFGLYNKRYGHIIGDRVLVKVAQYLRGAVDETRDVLVRYGGDEFAIGTIRTLRETEELLAVLERGIQGTLVAETDQPITFSAGIFGGRRTKERDNVHYSATLDSLINVASKAAQSAKDRKKGTASAASAPTQRPKACETSVVEVFFSGDSSTSLTTVILSRRDRVASGVQTRGELTKVQSVVYATLKGLERLAEAAVFELEDVQLSEVESGERMVTVSGRVEGRPVAATRKVERDLYQNVAEATLEAALTEC